MVFALALLVMPAFSDTVTLQQGVNGYAGTQDTHIISWDGNQNQLVRLADGTNGGNGGATKTTGGNPQNAGSWIFIEEGDYGSAEPLYDDSKCILIKFDLKGLTGNLNKAQIGLYYWFERSTGAQATEKSGTKKTAHTLYVNRILKNWAQGTSTTAGGVDGDDTTDNSGEVTWNSTGFELWQAMGAEGPADIAKTESEVVFDPAVGGWVYFDVTQSAKFWMANPGKNFGVKISQEKYPDTFLAPDLTLPNGKVVYSKAPVAQSTSHKPGAHDFISSENTDAARRPMLILDFVGTANTENWELMK